MDNSETPNRDVKIPLSYQKAEIIYKLTFFFARTYLGKDDPIATQMLLTARSAMLHIAKANAAAATSVEMELKLTNLAKTKLAKLRTDYKDFLSARQLPIWEKDSKAVTDFRQKSKDPSLSLAWYVEAAKGHSPEAAANMCISLLYQADCLLLWQLRAREKEFLRRGRTMGRMFASRQNFPRPQK